MWDCFYLNEPLENMQKQRVFWVLLIKYDNFSGKLTRIVHFCAKMCRKPCVFNSFWTFDSMFDHKWVWSLSKLCSVQHCKAGWARPVFSTLGKGKRDSSNSNLCCYELCGQPQSAGYRSQTGVMGWKKGVGVGRETCFWGISWYFTGKMPLQYQLPFK